MARAVQDRLSDREWAGKLFKKAGSACTSVAECTATALSIFESAADADSARAVFANTKTHCRSVNDYEVLLRSASRHGGFTDVIQDGLRAAETNLSGALDLQRLAELSLTYLGDRKWAKSIYEKALNAPDARQRWSDIALSIKNKLGDAGWARSLYHKF